MQSTDRKNHCVVLILVFLGCASLQSQAQRLPTTVTPEHYKLFLDPSIEGRTFTGEETIQVRITQPVSEIVLNSLGLDITLAEVTAIGQTQQAKVIYDKPDEMVRLALAHTLPAGSAELHLKYSGKLTEGLRGLYLSRSPRRLYAVTQFEGTYARMMFPGFDEPAFKAAFDLSVVVDKGDTAISNGRIISDEPLPGGARHKITFSTSPTMSTYLVALAIGDWQCLESTADGIPVRVCATPENKNAGKFALDVAVHSLKFYDQWYGIKYPFGKLDLVAIPDYEWGGMENTASIFFRETALLLNEDESKASVFSLQGHAVTIAHEIAHQWFGDLVTAAWWDDIWLNEGFATWMSDKPVEAWHPEWNLEASATASAQQIIGLDSLAAARAIHGNPNTPGEIKEMFDGITYQKGAAVLRMLEAYVGPEVFRKGVNLYLKEHANGNATSQDFWRAVAKVSGKPVDKIMPTFVLQAGVPIVSVKGSCQAGHESLSLEQQRFYISAQKPASATAQLWDIPVCVKTENGRKPECSLLSKPNEQVKLKSCAGWYFGNRDAKGYYRVFYDDAQNLTRLSSAAETALNAPERIALVEDTWAMARAGKYPIGRFMQMAREMRSEREQLVVARIAAFMTRAGSLISAEQKTKYNKIIRDQFAPLARELGWEPRANDTDEQKALRAILLPVMGEAGDPEAIAAANKIVQQYLRAPGSTDATLTGAAFSLAGEHGNAELYQTLSDALGKANSTSGYYNYLFALAQFRQPELVQRTLGLIDQGRVRQQDYPSFFSALLGNPAARDETWNYLKSHWGDLAEKVTSFGGRGAVSALGSFCSERDKQDVKQFFASHKAPGAERALQSSLDSIDNCMEFKHLQQTNMEKWLAAQQ
ncbi:MAG TPA: M1 family metallopeptidase [Candidatus Angelobacter sp.]|nr:M1 family metallopeptidase [Candidatus Angelobacter sp.]